MTGAERWERVQALFHAVADLPPPAREAALAGEADATIAAEVRAMLAADAAGHPLLDGGVARAADAVLTAPADLPALRFGPYRPVALLGEGGMGVVYRAVRDDLAQEVAVKVLRDAALSPARRQRFADEQRTLARLHHPGIARLLDADVLADGTPWFAMELVEGEPLDAWLARHSPPLDARLAVIAAIADAMAHAHGLAVIHRDLKPSNILVAADGTVRLVDFGIAKRLDADTDPARHTRTGLRLMTPAYAAPEQVRGGPVGTHTDVYALGVVAYELLAGAPPHDLDGLTPSEAATVIAERVPERPATAAARHPDRAVRATRAEWADLDVLVLTAMHRDPSRRYRTMEALLRDLAHLRRGEPLDARPDSLGYRAGKFLRRHRTAVLAAAAVLAVAVGGTALAGVRLARARDAALAEARRAERIQAFTLSLFRGGEDAVLAADSLRVGTLLARGRREAASLAAEPVVQAELLATLGGIYAQVGEFARADTLLRDALARTMALEGAGAPATIRRRLALAALHVERAEWDAADTLLAAAGAAASALSPPRPALRREVAAARAALLVERGAYDTAIAVLEPLLADPDDDPAANARADLLVQLGSTHFYAGRYDTAATLVAEARDRYAARHGPTHPLVADQLITLGAIAFQRGEFAEAERRQREALAITEAWYGPDHHETAAALTMVGRSLAAQERWTEARAVLDRSLAIQERVHGPVHPRVASALNERATVAAGEGRLDEAERDYRRMEAIYRAVHRGDHWLVGIAVSNQGGIAGRRGDHRLAERHYREALRLFVASQGERHLNSGIARVRLARALLGQGRAREALPEAEAGHAIVTAEMSPDAPWARIARETLAEAKGGTGGET